MLKYPKTLDASSFLTLSAVNAPFPSGQIPEPLGRLSKLTWLDLSNNKLTGKASITCTSAEGSSLAAPSFPPFVLFSFHPPFLPSFLSLSSFSFLPLSAVNASFLSDFDRKGVFSQIFTVEVFFGQVLTVFLWLDFGR